MVISAALDQWCPFKSPLSHALELIESSVVRPIRKWTLKEGSKAKKIIGGAIGLMTEWAGEVASRLQAWSLGTPPRAKEPAGTELELATHPVRAANDSPRNAGPLDRLRAIAAKRVLCTSEDANALICTAVYLQALESAENIDWLLSNGDVYDRLMEEGTRCFHTAS
ncbi:hypothetical protein M407DRAFT_26324 [Tulasnella calospora MUT 4182]|uniref:Uncharacterized protein n=1 Tax=Tulasnella calospora MUT 4182 TaxID=1051891 RepID=A0A0C3Q5B0_9AGAM|nr:hypothetical protein M407DRAFT_26324 [Tulasnella calospora MUT 4182]